MNSSSEGLGAPDGPNVTSGGVAYGQEATRQDGYWLEVADTVGPKPSLERATATARHLASTAGVTTGAISAAGILSLDQFQSASPASWAAVAAVVCAVLSVCLAVIYLAPSFSRVNPRDLQAVQEWVEKRQDREWALLASGTLLPISLVLAGTSMALLTFSHTEPTVTMTRTLTNSPTVDVDVACTNCLSRSDHLVTVLGGNTPLASGVMHTSSTGSGRMTLQGVPVGKSDVISLQVNGVELVHLDP